MLISDICIKKPYGTIRFFCGKLQNWNSAKKIPSNVLFVQLGDDTMTFYKNSMHFCQLCTKDAFYENLTQTEEILLNTGVLPP